FTAAATAGQPTAPVEVKPPTGVNEPPRSDQPNSAPLQLGPPTGGNSLGVQVVSAPNAAPAADAVVKPVGPVNTALPAVEKPAEAPDQVNDVKPGTTPTSATNPADAKKKKADLSDESSSKKKKKKGLNKLNPF
ncbi:MAG TPA: outer membrane protein assembly factor BamD, partial [Terracidiphilus sp.]